MPPLWSVSEVVGWHYDSADCSTQVILVLRLYALYNCSRRVAYAAGCAFGIQLLFLSGFAAFVLVEVLGSRMSSLIRPL